jgi:hypothetical protein
MEVVGKVRTAKLVELDEPTSAAPGTSVVVRVPDASNPYGGFWENLSLDELIRRQGTKPIHSLEDLQLDWPEEDDIDQFLREVKEQRR